MAADEEKGTGDKLAELQKDVDETAGLMKDNIDKVVERGEKLEDLEERTDDLEATTQGFKKTAAKITLKYYWRNTKVKLCIAGTIIAVILIIILIIVLATKPWEGGSDDSSDTTPTPTALLSSSTTPTPAANQTGSSQ